MAFLDDLLGNARWLDQYLGTQQDQNPGVTADESQRSPTPAPSKPKSVSEWLASMGLLGAGPQGTSPGILRPTANGASGVDETGFNMAYPGPAQANAQPAAPQGPIPGGPSYYSSPFGGLQIPTSGTQPDTTDLSAASVKQQPLPAVNTSPIPPTPTLTGPDTADRLRAMFGNLTAGLQEGGSGLIAGLFDAAKGAQTGIRTDPTGIALQNQRANLIAAAQYFQQRGATPEQAISLGILGANNPKIMEEQLSRYKNLEEKIANTPSGTGGGSPTQQLMDLKKGEAAAAKEGQLQAQAVADLPKNLLGIDTTIQSIDTLMKDPGLDYIAGPMSKLPNTGLIPAQSRALAQFEMLKGRAMIQGIHDLSGQGMRITQAEAMTAAQAQAALNQAQNTKDLKAAMLNYRNLLVQIARNNQEMAGKPRTYTAPPAPSMAPNLTDLLAERQRRLQQAQ